MRRRTPSLQGALLQTAALQLQAAAVPVAAHALGLLPAGRAASATTLPLCASSLHAAAFCAAFLCANALGFFTWVGFVDVGFGIFGARAVVERIPYSA